MGEGIKQVRVDNWGIYFLQRLQMFFSRTDYCDLTLQFEGNVQLKVHRLVMNACTEYFTFLEQTCPIVEENTIVMPEDLQSDVIVPIVNFMYTGMLEFHMSIYDKIYRAAELMDMPILIKVLEAQRQPISKAFPEKKKKEPSYNTWPAPKRTPPPKPDLPTPIPPKKHAYKRKSVPSTSTNERSWLPDPLAISDPPSRYQDNTPKPTRFEWPEDLPMMMDNSFSDISLTSQPLLTKEEENRVVVASSQAKKAVKENEETAEAAAIFGEEEELTNATAVSQKRKVDQHAAKSSPKRAKVSDKENKETTINIKSNSIGDLDHTKIVSEILKKYPDLVKKNKNIRLKIMSPTAKNPDKPTVVRTANIKVTGQIPKAKEQKPSPPPPTQPPPPPRKPKPVLKEKPVSNEGPWFCNKCQAGEAQEFVLYYLYRKHMQDTHHVVFDSDLCKFCGKKCTNDNIMAYHLYTKHGYKTSASTCFPKCDLCPYVAISVAKLARHHSTHKPQERQCNCCKLAFTSEQALAMHIQITDHREKNVRASSECQYCSKKTYSSIGLLLHVKTSHLKEAKRDGIVLNLKDLERMEEIDCEESEEEEEEYITPDGIDQQDKVKIISNVKVPSNQQQQESKQQATAPVVRHLEPSSEAEALNNVASGIATSLGLVDIVVLDEKGQYVLGNRGGGTAEYVLPDLTAGTAQNFVGGRVVTTTDGVVQPTVLQAATQEVSSTDELVMVLTDHDYQEETETVAQDNSNIVVLYSHPVDGQQGQFITSQGNLLVNSQTGMLELRNGSTMTTASSNQLIVTSATETPIESIEMIQREIDTHESVKNGTYLQNCLQETKPVETHGQDMPDIGEEPASAANQETAQPEETVIAAEEESQSDAPGQVQALQSDEGVQIQEASQVEGDGVQEDISKEDAVQDSVTEVNETAHEEITQSEQEQCAENPEQTDEDVTDGQQATDTTDHSATITAEEPMEIDEPVKEIAEPVQEPVAVPESSEEEKNVEDKQQDKEEDAGVDVPPDTQDSQGSEEVVVNDPSLLSHSNDWNQHQEEAMEVDGRIGNNIDIPSKEIDESDGLPEEKECGESAENEEQREPQAEKEAPVAEPTETEPSRVEAEPEVEDEDDTTQTSTTSSQDQNKTQTAILEDWEDTDSQQSERPNAAARRAQANQREEEQEEEEEEEFEDDEEKTKRNVDKLMDDWQDEEDEEKK